MMKIWRKRITKQNVCFEFVDGRVKDDDGCMRPLDGFAPIENLGEDWGKRFIEFKGGSSQ